MTGFLTLRRSLAALATPLLLVGGLAACGSDDETAAPTSSSASVEEGGQVDKADFLADIKSGLKASTTAQMTMHMDMGGQAIHAEGEVDHTTTPPQMSLTMSSPMNPEQSIEMRLVDKVMYMNMGQLTGDKFVKYDLSDASKLPAGMGQLSNTMNPLAALDSFEQGVKSVEFVGDEDVDGEQLAHYKITADTSKIDQLKELSTQAQLPDEVTYDLWLDDQNRIRKMTMEADMGSVPLSMEVEFTNWDEPVDIAAPPASQIVEKPAF